MAAPRPTSAGPRVLPAPATNPRTGDHAQVSCNVIPTRVGDPLRIFLRDCPRRGSISDLAIDWGAIPLEHDGKSFSFLRPAGTGMDPLADLVWPACVPRDSSKLQNS